MSAYRHKPPPPRARIIYRTPLVQRIGRGAVLGGFGVLGVGAIFAFAFALGLIVDRGEGGVASMFACFAVPVFLTAVAMLLLHWGTHLSEIAERTIGALQPDPADDTRCHVLCGSERWSLPMGREPLREGQTIQVRYRDVAARGTAARGREILEIRIVEEP